MANPTRQQHTKATMLHPDAYVRVLLDGASEANENVAGFTRKDEEAHTHHADIRRKRAMQFPIDPKRFHYRVSTNQTMLLCDHDPSTYRRSQGTYPLALSKVSYRNSHLDQTQLKESPLDLSRTWVFDIPAYAMTTDVVYEPLNFAQILEYDESDAKPFLSRRVGKKATTMGVLPRRIFFVQCNRRHVMPDDSTLEHMVDQRKRKRTELLRRHSDKETLGDAVEKRLQQQREAHELRRTRILRAIKEQNNPKLAEAGLHEHAVRIQVDDDNNRGVGDGTEGVVHNDEGEHQDGESEMEGVVHNDEGEHQDADRETMQDNACTPDAKESGPQAKRTLRRKRRYQTDTQWMSELADDVVSTGHMQKRRRLLDDTVDVDHVVTEEVEGKRIQESFFAKHFQMWQAKKAQERSLEDMRQTHPASFVHQKRFLWESTDKALSASKVLTDAIDIDFGSSNILDMPYWVTDLASALDDLSIFTPKDQWRSDEVFQQPCTGILQVQVQHDGMSSQVMRARYPAPFVGSGECAVSGRTASRMEVDDDGQTMNEECNLRQHIGMTIRHVLRESLFTKEASTNALRLVSMMTIKGRFAFDLLRDKIIMRQLLPQAQSSHTLQSLKRKCYIFSGVTTHNPWCVEDACYVRRVDEAVTPTSRLLTIRQYDTNPEHCAPQVLLPSSRVREDKTCVDPLHNVDGVHETLRMMLSISDEADKKDVRGRVTCMREKRLAIFFHVGQNLVRTVTWKGTVYDSLFRIPDVLWVAIRELFELFDL